MEHSIANTTAEVAKYTEVAALERREASVAMGILSLEVLASELDSSDAYQLVADEREKQAQLENRLGNVEGQQLCKDRYKNCFVTCVSCEPISLP